MHNFYFILFVSSGLRMCDRTNSLVCNDILNSQLATSAIGNYCERVECSLAYLSFASFTVPYNLMCFMYDKRTASIYFLILRLIIWCAFYGPKNTINKKYFPN